MKCSNCGVELPSNTKFCSNCGVEIKLHSSFVEPVVKQQENKEGKNALTQEGVTTQNNASNKEESFGDLIKRKGLEFWRKLSPYGKFTTIAIVVFSLLSLVAFFAEKRLASFMAIVSLALIIVALLIKKGIIKTSKEWLHPLVLILAIVLIVPYFSTFNLGTDADFDTNTDTSISDTGNVDGDNIGTETPEDTSSNLKIDYVDAKSFEKALNDGVKVTGKIVQFDVVEYKPDSILGINCWSGEHLNFISEDELNVSKGSIIIGRIKKEPINTLGSWEIHYEVLSISEGTAENDTTNSAEDEKPSNNQSPEITITKSDEDFKGMKSQEAEKIFREMGFTSFTCKAVDTETQAASDTICYIEITEFIFGTSDFEKGDKFDADSTVTFFIYKYKAPVTPAPVFYSTNDYETAKKGSSGVFSYKNKSGQYDIYWIVDFDGGYVYNFTEGNGESVCDKVKIVSGNLNSKITATWHYGGDQWSWFLYFKYQNTPTTLVVRDHYGSTFEFTTTDLSDALAIRKTKTIKEY